MVGVFQGNKMPTIYVHFRIFHFILLISGFQREEKAAYQLTDMDYNIVYT